MVFKRFRARVARVGAMRTAAMVGKEDGIPVEVN